MKIFLIIFLSTCSVSIIHAKAINIGLIFDGNKKIERSLIEEIKKETIKLNAGEFNIQFPTDKAITTNREIDSILSAINTLSQDKSVDIIIAHGLLVSNEAAHYKELLKPVIATFVADRKVQEFPYTEGTSLKKNFTYINNSYSVDRDLRQFHELINFKKLLLPMNPVMLNSLPGLRDMLNPVQQELGFSIEFYPVNSTLTEVLENMPADIDAVYMPPVAGFSEQELSAFAQGLIEKKLPSYSLWGRDDLKLGFMATSNGSEVDSLRFSRRVALIIQSILLGIPPSSIKVDLQQPAKLAINQKTAHAVGFYPGRQLLENAEALFNDSVAQGSFLSLGDAMRQAAAKNLALAVGELNIAQAEDLVDVNRSALLPQLSVGLSGTLIDERRAGIQQAEQSADVELNLSQLVYSESDWSNYDVAKLLKQAEEEGFKAQTLDIMGETASAYFRVLSAQAIEQVRQGNLKVSQANLELAKMRLNIGYSSRADVLRWQSVIATDTSQVYLAQAEKEQLETELKRLLHMDLTDSVLVSGTSSALHVKKLQTEPFNVYFDNFVKYRLLLKFEIERAINNSPELKQVSHFVDSSRRQLDARKRAYYIPDININARFGQNIDQGGRGRNNRSLQKDEWAVGLQASLPLFTSGARSAEVSRASHVLKQDKTSHAQINQSVEARVRSALQRAKGSFPTVRLSKDAALAAEENFNMVSDTYAQGQVSITSLIDAQNAALSAKLDSVEALYSFMIDWVEAQRSTADFDVFLSVDGLDKWYQALTADNQSSAQLR